MTRIVFIDLDGVVANADARFALAEKIATQAFAPGTKDYTNAYWHNVFMPEHVQIDTLIPGTAEIISMLHKEYDVIYLTSRPEHMRTATLDWLNQHHLLELLDDLVMKPASFQYVKTVIWKCGIIHTLAFASGASEVLVIDDEQMHLDELAKYPVPFRLRAYPSLEMKEIVGSDLDDEHPF